LTFFWECLQDLVTNQPRKTFCLKWPWQVSKEWIIQELNLFLWKKTPQLFHWCMIIYFLYENVFFCIVKEKYFAFFPSYNNEPGFQWKSSSSWEKRLIWQDCVEKHSKNVTREFKSAPNKVQIFKQHTVQQYNQVVGMQKFSLSTLWIDKFFLLVVRNMVRSWWELMIFFCIVEKLV